MEGPEPEEFGTSNHPFSTARAGLLTAATNTQWPYRASGKLYFQDPNNNTFVCSASMIKRGIVVTAAHCVANYGAHQFYHNWHFYPGYRNGAAPFGNGTVYQAWIKTAYYNGTDNCAVDGVVCPDDVAVLILNRSRTGTYAGTSPGWYGMDGTASGSRTVSPTSLRSATPSASTTACGWNATIRTDSCRRLIRRTLSSAR